MENKGKKKKSSSANQYTRSNETNEKYPFTNDKNKNDERTNEE